jgi:hypothetical protein
VRNSVKLLLMLNFTRFLTVALLMVSTGTLYSQTINTRSFHKVIISPYIEATFVQGDKERVVINHSVVDRSKLHIETSNGTLRIYLEGAKVLPRESRDRRRNHDRPLYPTQAVTATIYYKKLDALSLRGEERFAFTSPLSAERFNLKLYGEPDITFAEVHINDLRTTLYGEGSVEMQSGSVNKQTYTCYGEGKINATGISGAEAKLTAYGESKFNLNVSERITITSFGEATLRYKGNAQLVKGINVGGVDVARLD